jgi:hypothetical protein
MVAAVTAPAPTEHSSWTAAYLVLVAGVAQIGLGGGLALVPRHVPPVRWLRAQLLLWNVGNAAVVVGTLGGWLPLTDVGGLMLVATLLAAGWVTRFPRIRRWQWVCLRGALVLLLVSVPVGLVLARTSPT